MKADEEFAIEKVGGVSVADLAVGLSAPRSGINGLGADLGL